MTQNQPSVRARELRDLLAAYSYEYHALDKPSVSDAIYDSFFTELKKIEDEHPDLIISDSPTQRIGSKLSGGFKKVQHSSRMLSLNDVFDRADVDAWVKRTDKLLPNSKHEFFADIKMDGLACALIYKDGLFTQAITRGDSFIGEDVTVNVRTIKNIPLRLRKTKGFEKFLYGRTEIRGEIVVLKKDFLDLNKKRKSAGEPEFANPRNLAAGTIRQLDPRLVVGRPLHFRAYDLLRDTKTEIPTNMFAYEALSALGITRNQQASVFNSLNGVMKFVNVWEEKRQILPFSTDGLVIKVNDRAMFENLGIVGKQPRAAVAYKYAPEQATTIVRDIVISIGRTGAATPVAVFDPVLVAGSTVKHASLHNADEIARLDIRIGDTAVVFKAGDIIPQVQSTVIKLRPNNSKKFDFEKELKVQYPELKFYRPEGEAVYRIRGATGDLLLKKALEHFVSKGALDIDTLGEKNVVALVNAGLVNDLADIYRINKEQILEIERFANISANKLVIAIAARKNPPIERFLYGLGIRHVGTQTAIDIVNKFNGSLESIQDATIDQLQEVDGVGKVVAESIIAWFADPDNEALLDKFNRFGIKPTFKKKTGRLANNNFVITGTLKTMSRDEVADQIRFRGGTFQTAIARDTTYLIVGENGGTSKLKKAREYGVQTIDETKLVELLDN
jgi:DNA ligase (NAD+)